MENVWREMERDSKTQMQLLREFCDVDCVVSCSRQWLECAKQTLEWNNYEIAVFTEAVRLLLEIGQGKYRNVLTTSHTNCGKSFILNAMTIISWAFANPAQNILAWIGVENAEIACLNDLRWNGKLIPCNNFLQLLEGAEVHLAVPKNNSPEDIKFKMDTPIFATSVGKIWKYVAGVVHEGKAEMMDCQWNIQISLPNWPHQNMRVTVQPCPHCFPKLIVEHWEYQKLIKQHIFLKCILNSEIKTKSFFWLMFCYGNLVHFYTGKV